MSNTVANMLDWLEMPENEAQISNLAHFKNLENVEEVKNIGGIGGLISRFVMRFTQGHIDAFLVLAECKNAADIAAFRQTVHYEKIKNSEVGKDFGDLGELVNLKELKELKELRNL